MSLSIEATNDIIIDLVSRLYSDLEDHLFYHGYTTKYSKLKSEIEAIKILLLEANRKDVLDRIHI